MCCKTNTTISHTLFPSLSSTHTTTGVMEVQNPKDAQDHQQQQLAAKTLEPAAPKKAPPPPLQSPPPPSKEGAAEGGGGTGGDGKQQEEAKPLSAVGSPTAVAAATDLQKKLRRAERFGMTVQLSEEEKRSSRAERFGTGPILQGNTEEMKRKVRAERLALAGQPTADEEAKKKARLARFGQEPKPNSVEEEKRKARAKRFSETSSATPSQTNGKSETDQTQNTPTVDKVNTKT